MCTLFLFQESQCGGELGQLHTYKWRMEKREDSERMAERLDAHSTTFPHSARSCLHLAPTYPCDHPSVGYPHRGVVPCPCGSFLAAEGDGHRACGMVLPSSLPHQEIVESPIR